MYLTSAKNMFCFVSQRQSCVHNIRFLVLLKFRSSYLKFSVVSRHITVSSVAMGDKPKCPPVQGIDVCCEIPAQTDPCCTPITKDLRPLPPPEIMEKMKHAYEKIEGSEGNSLLKKYLTREVFDDLKYKMTLQESTLLDVIQSGAENPDSGIGAYASDPETYTLYARLFNPIISEYHGFGPKDVHPHLDWGKPESLADLDPDRKYIVSTRVRCGRTVQGFPFNPKMDKEQYLLLEQRAVEALRQLDGEFSGTYMSLAVMTPDEQATLIKDHYLFKEGDRFLQAAKACEFWPDGRGIFMNKEKTFLVWVGEEDHLRIISMQEGGNLAEVYKRLVDGMKKLKKLMHFVRHPRFGFVTFCPTNLGTTLRASAMMKLPNIGSDQKKLEDIAQKYNLQVRGSSGEHTESEGGAYDVSNKRRLGITEFQAVKEMNDGIQELITLEKQFHK